MNSKLFALAAAVIALALFAGPVSAAELSAQEQAAVAAATNVRTGPGLGIGLSVIGIGIGLGLIGYAALSGVARQPEAAGTLRGMMILLAALVEGAGIIGILFSLAVVFLG